MAARFVEGPRPFAPEHARQHLAGWLGDLAPEQADAIRGFADRYQPATLHGGALKLSDAHPGLRATLAIPALAGAPVQKVSSPVPLDHQENL